MYLTKIDLQLQNRGIRRALGDCQQLHRMVTGLFGVDRESGKILYRVRQQHGQPSVYLYSESPVLRDRLLPGMALAGERNLSSWLAQMEENQLWRFDLLASPAKKVAQEGAKNSRRRILRTEEERLDWLRRKAEHNGFELVFCQELESGCQTGTHAVEQGGKMRMDSYHYQGVLRICHAEQFRSAVRNGIGPGKAYGLGMLLLNRAA